MLGYFRKFYARRALRIFHFDYKREALNHGSPEDVSVALHAE